VILLGKIKKQLLL